MQVQFPEVEVELIGQDGNVFAIIGSVSKALKRAGYATAAAQFTEAAMGCESYDAVLALVMRTVEVS